MAQDETPRFAASHLVLFCLSMSYKKDARLLWVKFENILSLFVISIGAESKSMFLFSLVTMEKFQ